MKVGLFCHDRWTFWSLVTSESITHDVSDRRKNKFEKIEEFLDREVKRKVQQVKHLLPFAKLKELIYQCAEKVSECVKAFVLFVQLWVEGVALCSILQGGRYPKNIGLQFFHPYEPSSKTLGFVIFLSHLRSFFLRSFSSWRAVVEAAISMSFCRVAHFSAFALAACWISKILFDLDPLRTRHCPSLAWLVVVKLISELVRPFPSGAVWFGAIPGNSRGQPPQSGSGDEEAGTVEAFFFAKNLSSLSLFLALVLGDFRVFLTSGESLESRMFRAFVASREKERVPTLTVIRKSMFWARSCLAIAKQSFQGPDSIAEAEWCFIMCFFSQSRRLPVRLAYCKVSVPHSAA